MWEATSFQLERLQAAEECVEAEQAGLASRTAPRWALSFTPQWTPGSKMNATGALILFQHSFSTVKMWWLGSGALEKQFGIGGCTFFTVQ